MKFTFGLLGLFLLVFLSACINSDSMKETYDENIDLVEMTLEELSSFDGKNGRKAYIAVNGNIYDVTESSLWRNGSHNGFEAGQDLSQGILTSPHGLSTLSRFPIIGRLVE